MARRRLDAEESRSLIIDAVERLLEREGAGVVNTRSVALEAGMKPTLVHYHFTTTDNLLLEAYRRSAAKSEATLLEVITSDQPLRALWKYNSDPVRTSLATQFIALANQRQSLREEMAGNVERFRRLQGEAVKRSLEVKGLPKPGFTPAALAMLIAALGRAFVMENSIGVTGGHDDLRTLVEQFIDDLEPDRSKQSRKGSSF